MRLIIASGPNNFNFAVIDFTTPATPTVSHTTPAFGGSCTLDTNDELAAVGNMNGGQVELYDLSDPSAPTKLGSVATGLFGIAGLSFDGTRVLAGEMNGLRAALVDVADPSAPKLVSLITTGISSIASIVLAGTRAIAAGPNDDTIDIISYANPAAPTRATFFPNLNGPLVADLDGTRAAVGDQGGASVALVDIATRTMLGARKHGGLGKSGGSNPHRDRHCQQFDLLDLVARALRLRAGRGAGQDRGIVHQARVR